MGWELKSLREIRETRNDEYVWFWRRRELRRQGLYEREPVAGVGYIGWIAQLTEKGEERLAELEAETSLLPTP